MISSDFVAPPPGIRYLRYQGSGYTFDYPEGGAIVEFNHGDGIIAPRLMGKLEGITIHVNIEPWHLQTTAREAAENVYESASKFFSNENIAPYPLQLSQEKIDAWRTFNRFVDGASAPLVTDTVFVQTLVGLYCIRFTIHPQHYDKARWFFETVVRSFSCSYDQSVQSNM